MSIDSINIKNLINPMNRVRSRYAKVSESLSKKQFYCIKTGMELKLGVLRTFATHFIQMSPHFWYTV